MLPIFFLAGLPGLCNGCRNLYPPELITPDFSLFFVSIAFFKDLNLLMRKKINHYFQESCFRDGFITRIKYRTLFLEIHLSVLPKNINLIRWKIFNSLVHSLVICKHLIFHSNSLIIDKYFDHLQKFFVFINLFSA